MLQPTFLLLPSSQALIILHVLTLFLSGTGGSFPTHLGLTVGEVWQATEREPGSKLLKVIY